MKVRTTLIQKKVMNIIQLMMDRAPAYREVFDRYVAKGVDFLPIFVPYYETKFIDTSESLDFADVFRGDVGNESMLPVDIRLMLEKLTHFREMAHEPLKKSNLIRNDKLQTAHVVRVNNSLVSKASILLRKLRGMVEEANLEEDEEHFVYEEIRKVQHLIHIFQHETTRIVKLEQKIGRAILGTEVSQKLPPLSLALVTTPSLTVQALLPPNCIFPHRRATVDRIANLVAQTHLHIINTKEESRTSTESASPSTPCPLQFPPIPSIKPDSVRSSQSPTQVCSSFAISLLHHA